MSYKIEIALDIDKIGEYVRSHSEFIFKGKEDKKYGNFTCWINDKVKFNSDASICIKKKKDSEEKSFYCGNGKTTDFLRKQQFEADAVTARLNNKEPKNPFSTSSISLSINLTAISEFIKKHPKCRDEFGKIPIIIFINTEINEFGNDVSVSVVKQNQTDEVTYIGNGKTARAFTEYKSRPEVAAVTTGNEPTDGNPFEETVGIDDLPF